MEANELSIAESFFQRVATERQELNVSTTGRAYLNSDSTERISAFQKDTRNKWLVEWIPRDMCEPPLVEYFLIRYEEMERRIQKRTHLDDVEIERDVLYRLLVVRFGVLLTMYGSDTENSRKAMASAIIQNSKFVGDIEDETEFKWAKKGVIRRAIVGNATDPREFLRTLKQKVELICNDPEFAWCADKPSMVLSVALGKPLDTEGRLRMIKKEIDTISAEEEFQWCLEQPALIRTIIRTHPEKPRDVLRAIKESIDSIHDDDEFAWCRNKPYLVRRATFISPKGARGILRKAKDEIDSIISDPEYSWCKKCPSLVTYAAVKQPRDPRKFLSSLNDTFNERLKTS